MHCLQVRCSGDCRTVSWGGTQGTPGRSRKPRTGNRRRGGPGPPRRTGRSRQGARACLAGRRKHPPGRRRLDQHSLRFEARRECCTQDGGCDRAAPRRSADAGGNEQSSHCQIEEHRKEKVCGEDVPEQQQARIRRYEDNRHEPSGIARRRLGGCCKCQDQNGPRRLLQPHHRTEVTSERERHGQERFGVLLSAPAFAQAHIRGTLTAAKDRTISVQPVKGVTESIKLANDVGLFLVTKADMSAIQSGKFVGITSVEQGGKRVAREVHVFDDSLRGLAEGHYPWDLESEPNMMTNANIAKVEEVGTDRVLRLNYSGGEQTITIPTSAAVVAFDKAPADQLTAGRKVFVVMKKDGSEAAAVVIGVEGVKPPM